MAEWQSFHSIATTIGPRTGKTIENQLTGWELVLNEPNDVAHFLSDVAFATEPLVLTTEQRAHYLPQVANLLKEDSATGPTLKVRFSTDELIGVRQEYNDVQNRAYLHFRDQEAVQDTFRGLLPYSTLRCNNAGYREFELTEILDILGMFDELSLTQLADLLYTHQKHARLSSSLSGLCYNDTNILLGQLIQKAKARPHMILM